MHTQTTPTSATTCGTAQSPAPETTRPQTVMVMQGGGAVGAFHLGVYEALHGGGYEPHWVIGTSIGAINAALIAGNRPEDRLERLRAFWARLQPAPTHPALAWWLSLADPQQALHTVDVMTHGVSSFFRPQWPAWINPRWNLGVERAAYYDTSDLRATLTELVDFDYLAESPTRITVGTVNARTGRMRYFDSHKERIQVDHIVASGALAPAFGAVRIDGDPYWDGGLYSNTPIEVVLDDNPRRHSLIFACQLWEPHGDEPKSIWDVHSRLKDIQFASRAESHVERQRQIHRLRHIIWELAQQVPDHSNARQLGAWGCATVMHIVNLMVPHLPGEDHTKDIDFTTTGVTARAHAGLLLGRRALAEKPWERAVDPLEGICLHPVRVE